MTETENPAATLHPLRPTPNLLISIRADGLEIETPLHAPKVRLSWVELVLLHELEGTPSPLPRGAIARTVEATGVPAEDLKAFVSRLQFAGWLVSREEPYPIAVPAGPGLAAGPPLALDAGPFALMTPMTFRPHGGRFELHHHDGHVVLSLTPAELHALSCLAEHPDPVGALDHHVGVVRPGAALSAAGFSDLLGRVQAAGWLRPHPGYDDREDPVVAAMQRELISKQVFARQAAAQDAAEREREARTGQRRPKVVPVAFDIGAPGGIGMVVACAKAFEDGRLDEFYDFRLDWVWDDDRLEGFTEHPAVYLFANYLWSHERCINVSAAVKQRSPSSITVHGGPDTPKYEADVRAYFAAHPSVDVVVRGEGEISATEALAALTQVIGDEVPDLSVLEGVEGVCYRHGDEVVFNPDRDRVTDLNELPSPYLTGLFDGFAGVPDLHLSLETNRGCPYGCTFCDWGSATNSRIRQFDIERVYAELEWCSKIQADTVSITDANFGIFARDVDIAAKLADLKKTTGHPRGFGSSYAKNTVKHLRSIIKVLADADILTQGVLSLQSMDESTLTSIRRSNIKTEKYDALAIEMQEAKLPLMIELMMGLPGSTLGSFADDLQQCIDRELPVRVNHTELLVNSPMNDPSYRAENEILTAVPLGPGKQAIVKSTSTFTEDDFGRMEHLRLLNLLFENFGVLRQVARYVRQETGTREIDFYGRLQQDATPDTWPMLNLLVTMGSSLMAPPLSWGLVFDEVRRYLVSEVGVADDDALASVLAVQQALLPAHGRTWPTELDLPHDVAAWHKAILAAKNAGEKTTWTDEVPPLRELGPARLVIEDTDDVTLRSLGINRELNIFGVHWELASPFQRPGLGTHAHKDDVLSSV